MKDLEFKKFIDELPEELTEYAKREVLSTQNIDKLAKAITMFAFRSGPIEDMHANNQLSQEDMKKLNKFMVNRLAYVCELIVNEKWLELEFFSIGNSMFASGWDIAEVDDEGMRELFSKHINDVYKQYHG